jgi:hypothetical protein
MPSIRRRSTGLGGRGIVILKVDTAASIHDDERRAPVLCGPLRARPEGALHERSQSLSRERDGRERLGQVDRLTLRLRDDSVDLPT